MHGRWQPALGVLDMAISFSCILARMLADTGKSQAAPAEAQKKQSHQRRKSKSAQRQAAALSAQQERDEVESDTAPDSRQLNASDGDSLQASTSSSVVEPVAKAKLMFGKFPFRRKHSSTTSACMESDSLPRRRFAFKPLDLKRQQHASSSEPDLAVQTGSDPAPQEQAPQTEGAASAGSQEAQEATSAQQDQLMQVQDGHAAAFIAQGRLPLMQLLVQDGTLLLPSEVGCATCVL